MMVFVDQLNLVIWTARRKPFGRLTILVTRPLPARFIRGFPLPSQGELRPGTLLLQLAPVFFCSPFKLHTFSTWAWRKLKQMVIGVQHYLLLRTSQATKSNESWGFTNLPASSACYNSGTWNGRIDCGGVLCRYLKLMIKKRNPHAKVFYDADPCLDATISTSSAMFLLRNTMQPLQSKFLSRFICLPHLCIPVVSRM